MVNAKHLILIGAIGLFGTAHAQVNGVVDSLNGVVDGLVGPQAGALGGLIGTTTQGLGSLGSALPGDLGAAVPALINDLGNALDNGLGAANGNGLDLVGLANNLPGLSGGDLFSAPPPGQSFAGDLPATLFVPSNLIDPELLQQLLEKGVTALPAGALPANTPIPVSSLDGLDPALDGFVTDGNIAATLLPEDLPISASVLDPLILATLLQDGLVPAALLPTLATVPLGALAGL